MDEFEEAIQLFAGLRQNPTGFVNVMRQLHHEAFNVLKPFLPTLMASSPGVFLPSLLTADAVTVQDVNDALLVHDRVNRCSQASNRERHAGRLLYLTACWIANPVNRHLENVMWIVLNYAGTSQALALGTRRKIVDAANAGRMNSARKKSTEEHNVLYRETARQIISERGANDKAPSRLNLARWVLARCPDYRAQFPDHAERTEHLTPDQLSRRLADWLPDVYPKKNSSGDTL
jgi:hypothetical protein